MFYQQLAVVPIWFGQIMDSDNVHFSHISTTSGTPHRRLLCPCNRFVIVPSLAFGYLPGLRDGTPLAGRFRRDHKSSRRIQSSAAGKYPAASLLGLSGGV